MVGVGHVKVLERARVATGWFYAAAGAQSRWVRVRPLPAAAHALQERGSFVLAPAPVLSTMARVFKLPLVALALRATPAECHALCTSERLAASLARPNKPVR